MILEKLIPLIAAYFSTGFASYWFYPFLALLFLCVFPVLIRDIFLRRSH